MRCLLHQQTFSKSQFWGWSGFVAMRWQRDGSSTAICKSSFRKGRRGGVHVPQMKLLSIHNPIFHSSSAVNASLSSRRGLIASCLISSSTRFLFIQLQRSDWPLIITYPFSPLSLSGLESYSFFVVFFFFFWDYHRARWTLTCYYKPVGNLTSDHFPSYLVTLPCFIHHFS